MKKKHSIDFLFVIFLFFIFVIMSVSLVFVSVNIYNSISDRQENNNISRTTLSYIANKILSANAYEDKVSIIEKDGKDVLMINSQDNEMKYSTLIFYKDGYVKEANILKDSQFTLDFGNNLIKTAGLEFEIVDNKVFISVTDNKGNKEGITVNIDSVK